MRDGILLELTGVKTFFKVRKGLLKAVNGVNLELRAGETLGLVGESGCGKSTLGKTIVRHYRPQEGQISYRGRDIWCFSRAERKNFARKVQMIFQDPYASLDPLMVVHESVSEGLGIHGLYSRRERHARAVSLLEMVGLTEEHSNRFPHEFSGGQRQRIGIARALALEPEIIVCDEPISALDVSIQAQIVNLLKSLQDRLGIAYLFITHDMAMVRQISNRVAVMYLGCIVETAPADALFTRCRHPYTEALISAIPIADPEIEETRRRIILPGDATSPVGLGDECCFNRRCPIAIERCRHERPILTEVGPGHAVACHLRNY